MLFEIEGRLLYFGGGLNKLAPTLAASELSVIWQALSLCGWCKQTRTCHLSEFWLWPWPARRTSTPVHRASLTAETWSLRTQLPGSQRSPALSIQPTGACWAPISVQHSIYLFIYLKATGPKGHLHCSEVTYKHIISSQKCQFRSHL